MTGEIKNNSLNKIYETEATDLFLLCLLRDFFFSTTSTFFFLLFLQESGLGFFAFLNFFCGLSSSPKNFLFNDFNVSVSWDEMDLKN